VTMYAITRLNPYLCSAEVIKLIKSMFKVMWMSMSMPTFMFRYVHVDEYIHVHVYVHVLAHIHAPLNVPALLHEDVCIHVDDHEHEHARTCIMPLCSCLFACLL
jgi:hypothetical protein